MFEGLPTLAVDRSNVHKGMGANAKIRLLPQAVEGRAQGKDLLN